MIRALLLTDVVDSTRISEELGDERMARLGAAHDRAARDLLATFGGREIDKSDGFLFLFDSAEDAVSYALAYHRALSRLGPPLKARVGIHVGPVTLRENFPEDVERGAKPMELEGLAKSTAARVMAVAGGGQTLASADAVATLGDVVRRASAAGGAAGGTMVRSCGYWRLKGVQDPIELFEVGASVGAPSDGPKAWRVVWTNQAWVPVRTVAHTLPAERDTFVGRQADLAQLTEAVEGGRLVTVLGIGGTGKTRLVTRFAWTSLGDFPGGVWFCDLSDARTVDGIAFAVGRGLELPLGKESPLVQIGHAIAGRGPCLVVLDNFEQVAGFGIETLGPWLDRAPEAHFVVTSRVLLNLPGERALSLAPLHAPDAVDLFCTRARAAWREFEFFTADRPHVERLVHLLDGLPLAIELAAARVRLMPPRALVERMGERFKLLAAAGGRPGRHATMRGVLDWSWDLLTEAERAALAQIAVFEGGLTLDAAEAVIDLSGIDGAPWTVDAVQALVDKSLVLQAEGRFGMLMSVQEYAAERLERCGAGVRQQVEARHGAWFGRLGEQGGAASGGVEVHNLIAAVRRAVARGEGAVAVPALEGAWGALELTGPFSTGASLAAEVAAMPGLPRGARARADRVAGSALWLMGRMEEARALFEGALVVHRDVGDRAAEGLVLAWLGRVHREQGRVEEARQRYEEALAVHREVKDRRQEGIVLGRLGRLYGDQGREAEARAMFELGFAVHREVGDLRSEGAFLNDLGLLNQEHGREQEARGLYERAVALHRAIGDHRAGAVVLGNLGLLEQGLGRLAEAQVLYRQALDIHQRMGDRRSEGIARGNLGNLLRVLGDPEARACLLQALETHRELGFTYGQPYWLAGLALLHLAAGEHDRALEHAEDAVALGARYPLVQAEALGCLARVRVARGEVAQARAAANAARDLRQHGKAGVLALLVDALVAAAEGDRPRAMDLLAEATRDAAKTRPGSEEASVLAQVHAAMG